MTNQARWVTGWDRAAEAAPGRVMGGLRPWVLAGAPSLTLLRALAVWRWGSPAWTGCPGFWPACRWRVASCMSAAQCTVAQPQPGRHGPERYAVGRCAGR